MASLVCGMGVERKGLTLITSLASMLREHGAERPSVFDLLDAVHKMRGTQSKFHYVRNTVSVFTAVLTAASS